MVLTYSEEELILVSSCVFPSFMSEFRHVNYEDMML